MSGQTLTQFVNNLIQTGQPDAARLAQALGTSFKTGPANPYWSTYTFNLTNALFAAGEFRQSKDGRRALLVLEAGDNPGEISFADLAVWGDIVGISPNPKIPPEGADAYIYKVQGVRVSVQFTHVTQKLLLVSLEWGQSS